MENGYIDFYGENGISPVNQNIDKIEVHYRRRQKLYRQLGVPTIAFKNAEMLEVGPGGGHNALAPLHWGIKSLDLVEPNQKGIEILEKLFKQQGILADKVTIHNTTIEEFSCEKKYDIIIAEGFLGLVPDAKGICQKFTGMVRAGGIIVITCSDEVGNFIELMKRLVGQILVHDEKELTKKVERLIPIFEPQLSKLRGVSRPAKDWVEDNILNPVVTAGNTFSMGDALDVFEQFDLLGASPQIFTNYSWYKDIWYDEMADYKLQFREKRISMVMAGIPEQVFPEELSSKMAEFFKEIQRLENLYEKTGDKKYISMLRNRLEEGKEIIIHLDQKFVRVYNDVCNMLSLVVEGVVPDMTRFPYLFEAFGRALQYMCFMKR